MTSLPLTRLMLALAILAGIAAEPRHKVVKWEGGTYVVFDGWRTQTSTDETSTVQDFTPPDLTPNFHLRVIAGTPGSKALAAFFDTAPGTVEKAMPSLKRKGELKKRIFGTDEGRVAEYDGEWKGQKTRARAIFLRRKGVAVAVLGIGTEEGFKQHNEAIEAAVRGLSFRESPFDRRLIGTWTWRAESTVEDTSVTSVRNLTLAADGTFTEYRAETFNTSGRTSIKEGKWRGKVVRRGHILSFERDDGTAWSAAYRPDGSTGLWLGRLLFIKKE